MVGMRGMTKLGAAALLVFQAAWVSISLYQTAISIAGRLRHRPMPAAPAIPPRFLVIVCARNEEAVISGLIGDLLAQDYPPGCFETLVVAHNCSDRTAAAASALGVRVVELATARPGKAAAIRAGLAAGGDGWDFVGIFDADARVP
ncbi:MAG: glycosyltransferase, partial [Tepidiformaceae bacterium]